MELGDGCDKRKPQPCTGSISRTFQSGESLKDEASVFRWNAGSLIGHRQGNLTGFGFLAEGDAHGSSASILQSILQEVGECLGEKVAISLYPDSLFGPDAESQSRFFGHRFVEFAGILDE